MGWLVLFGICFLIYSNLVYKNMPPAIEVEGQVLYTAIATFFWITVYMALSSVWSILYSLIDLKYPDIVGAVSSYGTSGFSAAGIVYDAFAFPLSIVVVSSFTSLLLAFWLISKFQTNKNLRPQKLYQFLRALVFIGGAIMIFSGFVYVVYSWLYGNLPMAVFLKGFVAVVIVGVVGLYFYLVGDGDNPREALIGRIFASFLVIVTIVTLVFSFNVIGTPGEARLYRLDSITLSNLQSIKNGIDDQALSYAVKIQNLNELNDYFLKDILKKTEVKYSSNGNNYTLCANFNSDMPKTINMGYRDEIWDYKKGESCFTFKHQPPRPDIVPQPKPVQSI